jgi:hypothetical protein
MVAKAVEKVGFGLKLALSILVAVVCLLLLVPLVIFLATGSAEAFGALELLGGVGDLFGLFVGDPTTTKSSPGNGHPSR